MQRISDARRKRAWKMYKAEKSIHHIAKSVRVSYSSAWTMTEGRRQGFKNRSEYLEDLAKRQGFKNYSEYQEHLVQQKGFKNRGEYLEDLAKR